MNARFRMSISRCAVLVILMALPMANAMADYRLDYTGNPFAFANGDYTTGMSVTGSFTLSDELFNSLKGAGEQAIIYPFTIILPGVLSYQFNDGVQSFNNIADIDAL
jgi:hypothetical protein